MEKHRFSNQFCNPCLLTNEPPVFFTGCRLPSVTLRVRRELPSCLT